MATFVVLKEQTSITIKFKSDMISKEVMEVKYGCEIKIDNLFVDAIKRIKEILIEHKCDGKVFNKRITDMIEKELGISQFCAVRKDSSGRNRYIKVHLNNYERWYSDGDKIKGYVEQFSILGLDVIVDLQNERIKLAETLKSLDESIAYYENNIVQMNDYMENYDTYKSYDERLKTAIEEYNKNMPKRLRSFVEVKDYSY